MVSISSLAQPGNLKLFKMKMLYARIMWASRSILKCLGLYDRMVRSDSSKLQYIGSLFAIYDVEEMTRQDVAWWSYGAISAVDKFLESRPGATVFEFGSGASTVWLARRARSVVSVEDDEKFGAIVRKIAPENVDYRIVPADSEFDRNFASARKDLRDSSFKQYVQTIKDVNQKFDLVVIDGRCRQKCMEMALEMLKTGGIILLDNSDMQRYRLIQGPNDMRRIAYHGRTPCLPYPTETSIFFRAESQLPEGIEDPQSK